MVRQKIKMIPKSDLKKAFLLRKNYVGNISFSLIKKRYEKYPELFVGCYKENELIGIVFGYLKRKEVVLDAIAVKEKYWRKGIGSKMLKLFEKQVKKIEMNRISVGVADNVVRFYIKNGFKPKAILLKVRKDQLPKDYKKFGFEIIEERNYKNIKKIYLKIKKFDQTMKNKIQKRFNANEAIWIFEKEI